MGHFEIMSWFKGLTSLQGHWLRPAKGWAHLLCYAVWGDSAIWMGVLGRTLDNTNNPLHAWEFQGAAQGWWCCNRSPGATGSCGLTKPAIEGVVPQWIGNGREKGRAAAWYTPARLYHHSLGEAGWGKLPEGCTTSVCLSLASLDVRAISTIQTSPLFGASSGDLCGSVGWVITMQPWYLCTLALNAQFRVLKDL